MTRFLWVLLVGVMAAGWGFGCAPGTQDTLAPRDIQLRQELTGLGVPLPDQGHILYVVFSLSDCGGCLGEAEVWERLQTGLKSRGLQVVGIAYGESPEAVSAFVEDEGLSFPVHYAADTRLQKNLGILNTPYKFLLGNGGEILLEDPPNNSPKRQRNFQRAVEALVP